jgi:hypothetical protein
MIRLIYALRRSRDLPLNEFHEHWRQHHVGAYGLPIPEIRRLVQYAAVENQLQARAEGPEPLDGIASAWADDLPTLSRVTASAMESATEDERKFIDHDRSRAAVCEDHVLAEPYGPAPIVLFECVQRREGSSLAEFSEAWLEHGARIREQYDQGLLSGYIQSHVVADPQGGTDSIDVLGPKIEPWDGFGAAYFQSLVLARRYLDATDGLPSADAACVATDLTVSMLSRRDPIRSLVR